ncbi:MAG: hypothetical protein Q8O76_12360 [Chloroflexota bacterium]|nr:hypothetical protein [Chloroflexota bacterium]
MGFPELANLGGLGAIAAAIVGMLYWLLRDVRAEARETKEFLQNHMTSDQKMVSDLVQKMTKTLDAHNQALDSIQDAIRAQTVTCRSVQETVLKKLLNQGG